MNTDAPVLKTIDKITDKGIEIVIPEHKFCITGQMKHGKRSDIHDLISAKGGIVATNVSMKLDYLVVGALSNPCWMYSTYGRKIEQVMNHRKDGIQIYILDEDEFYNKLTSC